MRMKLLGERTGVQVSPLALGTGRLGLGPGGDVNLAQARDAIAAYLDAGGNLVDTSTRRPAISVAVRRSCSAS